MQFKDKIEKKLSSSSLIHLLLIILFLIGTSFAFLLSLLSFVLIRPLSKTVFRRIIGFTSHIFAIYLVFLVSWSGSKIYLYSSDEEVEAFKTESKLLILNHSGAVDWLFIISLTEMLGLFWGLKMMIKRETIKIPIVGWQMWLAEWLDVKRNFNHDKPVIERKVENLLEFPYAVTLGFYPEGTRFTTKKHETSVEFAEAKGLTPLKHLLIPRTKGFLTLLPKFRKQCKSIFDATWIFTNGESPSLTDLLNRNAKDMHILLKRIPLEEIPVNEKNAEQWLHSLFVEKDKSIGEFLKKGRFEAEKTLLKPWWSMYVGMGLTVIALVLVYNLCCYIIFYQAWGLLIGILFLFVIAYGFLRLIDKAMTVKNS